MNFITQFNIFYRICLKSALLSHCQYKITLIAIFNEKRIIEYLRFNGYENKFKNIGNSS